MCARDNEAVQKVTGGGSHQNANVVWDIYCRVLMQFKTGSLSCSPSPSPCWALINQPLKADVTWIALQTAAIQLYHHCGIQTTAEKFMKMPLNNGRPRRDHNTEFVRDATVTNTFFSFSLSKLIYIMDVHRPIKVDLKSSWQTLKVPSAALFN